MKNFKFVTGMVLGAALAVGGMLVAQERHPNLAAARQLIDQAIGRFSLAQQYNEYDMGGHAARAKDLLMQAKGEIRAADRTADR